MKVEGGGSTGDGRMRPLMMERTMRGTINGGGVEASFYDVNGRITVHKK